MRYRRTYLDYDRVNNPRFPVTRQDILYWLANMEDAYYEVSKSLPLPKNSLKDKLEMSYASLYAFTWDMSQRIWRERPRLLETLRLLVP